MSRTINTVHRNALHGLIAAAAICSFGSSAAFAQPDLVVNVADSVVTGRSCEKDSPLAVGRIAIKNIGATKADRKVVDRVRSMLAVYVPENIDMIAKKTKGENLDAYDQEGIAFEVGTGVEKRGRFFGEPPTRVSTRVAGAARTTSGIGRTRAIQRALTNLGFDTKGIDGVYGRNTRAAASAYQRSQQAKATGTLTNAQIDRLVGGSSTEDVPASTGGARGPVDVRIYAVVDPYNVVQESDESNNIVKFTVRVDCSK